MQVKREEVATLEEMGKCLKEIHKIKKDIIRESEGKKITFSKLEKELHEELNRYKKNSEIISK